ncbi:protein NnrT [uncultured Tateyamaria sp.]|uniref:protein NnrT n=1 Tax=uncultured Tateyamaria sp. TaxID=455651 RepID=UPI002619420E|nr:protein NnrT [uncultured Tateyamaria sp.]
MQRKLPRRAGRYQLVSRPIPQAQSATAEFWYALASLTLLVSMIALHWLVSRR